MKVNQLKEKVAKVIVEAAVETAKMPNQMCIVIFGEAKSDLTLQSVDYKNMAAFLRRQSQ